MSSNNNSGNLPPDASGRALTQWKPGTSGNPKGRWAGIKQVSLVATLRRKVAMDAERKHKRGEIVTGTIGDQIVEELIDLALHCRVAKVKLMAIVTILDRLEGKAVTPVAVSAAETELTTKVKLAYQAVMQFAEVNGLSMSPEAAVGIVASREPKAAEILREYLTIDVEAAATDGTAGTSP